MNYQISLFGIIIIVMSIHATNLSENISALNTVSSGINEFSNRFNKILAKEEFGNYICSPFSVAMVLSMALCGAGGLTKQELWYGLHKNLNSPNNESTMQTGYQALMNTLNDIQGVELSVVNKIFTTTGFEVKNAFKEITKFYFRSEFESLDFSKTNEATEIINNWIAVQTKHRINEIVNADDVKKNVMIMINAIYFKGKWAKKFDKDLTRSMPFHINETTTKNVDMMYRNGMYNWGLITKLNAKYIELPYENENISMFIFLPNKYNGLQKIEEDINTINLADLNERKTKVELYIPKFKIENKFDLKSTLNKMDFYHIFEDSANFEGITDSIPLKVGKIIQKAFIEVNEEGSETGAITGLQIVPISAPIFKKFIIDKPFFYAIVLKIYEKMILFNGRIVDPTL